MADSFECSVIAAVVNVGRDEFMAAGAIFVGDDCMFGVKGIFSSDLSAIVSIYVLGVFHYSLVDYMI